MSSNASMRNKITETDLAILLQNRTFVDYFNVYLSLPAFSQRLIYKYDEKDFEFEPPIKRSSYVLDRKRLAEWLLSERIPGFLKTDLYFEYLLCEECLTTKLHFTESSHRIDYEEHKRAENVLLLRESIGHVVGMRHFRHYIAGTPGEKVLNFWLDAERFHNIPVKEAGTRWRMFREIQIKYFKGELFETPDGPADNFDVLRHGRKILEDSEWSLNNLCEKITQEDVELCSSDTPRSDSRLMKIMEATDFSQIQYLILTVLKDYWVQKYVLHCQFVKSKSGRKKTGELGFKLNSLSDLAILKDIKEIDKALNLLQSSSKRNSARNRKSKFSWRAMFPEHVVDQSFLEEGGEIVTLHDDGLISVDPIDERILDKILERYILSPDESKVDITQEEDAEDIAENNDNTEEVNCAQQDMQQEQQIIHTIPQQLINDNARVPSGRRSSELRSISLSSRRSSGTLFPGSRRSSTQLPSRKSSLRSCASTPSQIAGHTEESSLTSKSSWPNLSTKELKARARLRQRRSSDAFIKRVQGAIQREKDKKPKDEYPVESPSTSRPRSAVDIMRHIAQNETNRHPASLMKASIELFEQLLLLNFDPWQEEQDERERPQSCPSRAGKAKQEKTLKSKHGKLPKLNSKEGKKEEGNPWENVKLPSIKKESTLVSQYNAPQMMDRAVQISTPTYVFRTFSEGYYRFDNKIFVLAVATDSLTGNPFKTFLKKRGYLKSVYALLFWNDAQTFLNTKSEREQVRQRLRCRRSKILILRYLSFDCKSLLPPGLMTLLKNMLLDNRGDDLLRDAQDFVCKRLHSLWQLYLRHDRKKFAKRCLVSRRRCSENFRRKSISESRFDMPAKIPEQPEETTEGHDDYDESATNKESGEPHDIRMEDLMSEDTKSRMDISVQITLDISEVLEEGLPIEPFNVDELTWDAFDSYGSLALKPRTVIHRQDILDEIARQQLIAKQRRTKLKLERIRLSELDKGPKVQPTNTIPLYLKPVKKNGTWYNRTAKPRSFQDMLKDDIQREFFRRFLIYNSAEAPLHFYQIVNDIRDAKEAKAKQTKIAQVMKKYFTSEEYAVQILATDADIIRAIPNQKKVTQAMLISAQNWVMRSLQDQWFDAYVATFTENNKKKLLSEAEGILNTTHATVGGKARTKQLWRRFVKSLVCFRHAIMDSRNAQKFIDWLRLEAKIETKRQHESNPTLVPGSPIRKLIKNRWVDVHKLGNDLHFLAETDRYRTLCDSAAASVREGKYYPEDEHMVESKAKTIVECYLDSEILPRVQINVTQEQIDAVLEVHESGIIERGLFHKLTLTIFPIMAFLWTEYQSYRVRQICQELEDKKSGLSNTSSVSSIKGPDYHNLQYNEVSTKKVCKGHEDDAVQIHFSMSQGLRLILPIYHHYQEMHFQKGDDQEFDLQSILSTANKLHQQRTSVLRTGPGVSIMKLNDRRRSSYAYSRLNTTIESSRVSLAASSRHQGQGAAEAAPGSRRQSLAMSRQQFLQQHHQQLQQQYQSEQSNPSAVNLTTH